jgi:hypothetical protein
MGSQSSANREIQAASPQRGIGAGRSATLLSGPGLGDASPLGLGEAEGRRLCDLGAGVYMTISRDGLVISRRFGRRAATR